MSTQNQQTSQALPDAFTARLTTASVDQTIALGRELGECLQPGDVVALVGRLGAGKTHLSKGLALGLGVADAKNVNSPTFVLVNEYAGRSPIHHIDAYRLNDPIELDALGFDEMLTDGAIVLLEWADRVAAALPSGALWIEIETPSEDSRVFNLRTADAALAERLHRAALTTGPVDAITDPENPATDGPK